MLLDVAGHLGSREELLLSHRLLYQLLDQQRFLVLPLLLHGRYQGPRPDFLVSPELSELMQDRGVPQVQVLRDVLQVPVVSSVMPLLWIQAFFPFFLKNLRKNLIHLQQLFLGDQSPNFSFLLSFSPPGPCFDPLTVLHLRFWEHFILLWRHLGRSLI